jgi:hypothetical protein
MHRATSYSIEMSPERAPGALVLIYCLFNYGLSICLVFEHDVLVTTGSFGWQYFIVH